MNKQNVKRIGLVSSIVASSLLSFSCDSGGDDNSSTLIPTDNNNPTQGTPNSNAEESYIITVDFVSGNGLGYKVGDTVLIQRTSDTIIIGDSTYSPYEQFLNSSAQGQYTFNAGDDLLGVLTIGRSAKFVLVSDGGNQFRGQF